MQKPTGDESLQRLTNAKRIAPYEGNLMGPSLIHFFRQSVQKRQTKLGKIAECWARLVPELLLEHCALEGFTRGSLTVVVDSASHLYELKQLLLAGLQQQIILASSSSGLKKIVLRRGTWYASGTDGETRLRFEQ